MKATIWTKLAGMLRGSVMLAAAGLLAMGTSANAATVGLGTLAGTDVTFNDIEDETTTDIGSQPLYGSPNISVNTLFFVPFSLGAASQNGASDTTTGILKTDITPNAPGNSIASITIAEQGDWTLQGPAGAAILTASATVRVVEVDGSPITPVVLTQPITFTPSPPFVLPVHAGSSQIFSGQTTIDITTLLAGNAITGSATRVELELTNSLATSSITGSNAVIKISGVDITAGVTAVPLPGAAWAGMVLLGGMGAARLRRKVLAGQR